MRFVEQKEQNQVRSRLEDAIRFAIDCHEGQKRKGSSLPYIVHPLEVMQILLSMGAEEDLVVAGLLHDVIEDTGVEKEEIENRFGESVAELVDAHSEDKSKTWEERKAWDIETARNGSKCLKMLIMSDKVSNLRSLLRDQKEMGELVWKKFNAPKEKQAWYYTNMREALREMECEEKTRAIYLEMTALIECIF